MEDANGRITATLLELWRTCFTLKVFRSYSPAHGLLSLVSCSVRETHHDWVSVTRGFLRRCSNNGVYCTRRKNTASPGRGQGRAKVQLHPGTCQVRQAACEAV